MKNHIFKDHFYKIKVTILLVLFTLTTIALSQAQTTVVEGPGGVTTNLELWLKANDGAGLIDNVPLSIWYDQAKTNNATVPTAGQEPTYRDHPEFNVNFNGVVDFENDNSNVPIDYTYSDTSRDVMAGTAGYFSNDIYIVVIPDTTTTSATPSMDLFCADSNTAIQETDGTGIGFGRYSTRFDDEVLSYAQGITPNGTTLIDDRGYGVAQTNTTISYNNVGIINARHNTNSSPTGYELLYNNNNIANTEVGLPQFSTVTDANFWIGRSEGYGGSLDGRILEVITYSSRNTDDPERNRIESYLAIKYGITLGTNGISQDYVAADGSIIWDVSANTGYNYDIAGIGRDDLSDLNQKQSKSVNNNTIVSVSLNDTELTNNLNSTTFDTSNEFLVWGNNGLNTNASTTSITINLAPDTVTTITNLMNRKWKITETLDDDVGTVEVSIFETDFAGLPSLTGNDAYVMLVSEDPNFTSNLQTVFLDSSTFNSVATREGSYDFDGTRYFTFGIAHEEVRSRHLDFDGMDDYTLIGHSIDLNGPFTASAWIKPDGANALNTNKAIISKSNSATGYKLYLTDANVLSFSVGNTEAQRIESNTILPDNIWHHVAVIYNGVSTSLFIDGVLDNTKTLISPTPNNTAFSIGASYSDKTNISDYFKGDIDEIQVWNAALTLDQLRYVMNQELEKIATNATNGSIIPNAVTKNEMAVVNWNTLLAYYNINSFIGTQLNDVSGNGNMGSLKASNTFTLEHQSAPLPYTTLADGDWNNSSTWTNGSEQYIPGSTSIVDPIITIDWNIVRTSHNLTLENTVLPSANLDNRRLLGLFVDANELTVNGNTATASGNGLTITHYLSIHGKIDLEGESQLIQTLDSDLDPASTGTLERDQQGTKDLYTYNYWSSPVGVTNGTTNNTSYTVPQIYKDGTDSATPIDINYITNGYNGTSGTPIGIADFWIWKYANLATNYYNWEHVRSTGSLKAGEGFTMKGVTDTGGNVTQEQNYVLEGKPNNAQISLIIDAGNEYLVGNPYASAIDANQFIIDNPSTNGTLYYWEHWGGGTHSAAGYKGGYATYSLSGVVPAMQYSDATGGTPSGGIPTTLPGRYIPVAQGFFVTGSASGTIVFNNNQRVFEKEGIHSTFFKTANHTRVTNPPNVVDNRLKIRLGYKSVNNTYSRQLLLTVDNEATSEIDFGFDSKNIESQARDMYWLIDSEKFIIQGIHSINESTVLPLELKTATNGINTIKIDQLENVPNHLDIYIFDSVTNVYHDIRDTDFTVYLSAGAHMNRFELHFNAGNLLSTDDFDAEATGIEFYFANNNETIVVNNPKLIPIQSVELFNTLGQSITKFNQIKTRDYLELKPNTMSTGHYILEIKTEVGKLSKKVLVE